MELPFFNRKKGGSHSFYVNKPRVDTSQQDDSGADAYASLERLIEDVDKQEPFNRVEHLDKKLAFIALIFVWGYLGLVFLIMVGAPLYNRSVGSTEPIDLDKILAQVGALLGTPLGFVVGYYFKEDKRR